MKKVTLIIAVLALLVSSNIFAAKVNNVELFYKDGFTVAKIDVDGTVRFSHQTEEAKDGKPFRVIVDVLSATHNLGKHSFANLPNCPIKKIRSSQYAVQPEQVTRIVFDMDSERVYRIDSDNNSITITFSDKSTKPFENWASANNLKKQAAPQPTLAKVEKPAPAKAEPKSTKQLNKSINDDRMLSLEGSTPKATAPAPEKKVVAVKPKVESTPAPAKKKTAVASKPTQFAGPAVPDNFSTAPVEQKSSAKASQPKAEPKKEASKPVASQPKAEPKKATSKPVASQPKAEPKKQAPVKAESKTVASKPKAEPKKAAPAKAETKTVASKKADTQPKATVAKADDKTEKSSSTSRFRRNPAQSKKIQGTLVAEFPKRLVIKYKTTKYRDPFETLINETKTYNDPVNKIVPNVEGLRLVGIIQSDDNGNRALFEDNTGYGYILKTGDKVKKGYVLRVDSDRVYFQIFEYGWSRTVSLVLES